MSSHAADVTDEKSVDAAIAAVAARHGGIDILVNSAGIGIRRAAVELPLAEWDKVVAVNLTGVFLCSRAAARQMMRRGGGAIVNLASIMGFSGGGIYPNVSYQATKGAVVNMTRALAVEWASSGIRVNAVAPTWVRTNLTAPLLDQPGVMERIAALTPMGRLATPEEIAHAILYLQARRRRWSPVTRSRWTAVFSLSNERAQQARQKCQRLPQRRRDFEQRG